MLYRNERSHNHQIETGNVLHAFEEMRHMINVNDGTRSFSFRTVDCHDQPAPFTAGQYSQISLTHPDHFISDVDKGFLTFHVKLDLQLNTDLDKLRTIEDPQHFYKLFVGFKSSNQLFDRLEILHNNVNVGYQQNECVREGFLYSALKPETEKKRRRFVHSLWENVSQYSQTMAGTYVNLMNFKENGRAQVEFDLNLPFDDLLALQAFDLFPNGIIGDLSIRFQVSPAGLVWAVIDPYVVAETKAFLEDDESVSAESLDKLRDLKVRGKLKRQFTQIGNEATIPSVFDQTLTIKYQRIHAGNPVEEDETPKEVVFHYTTDDYEKFHVKESDVNKGTFAEMIASANPDAPLAPGDVVKILETKHKDIEYSNGVATLTCNQMTITLCKSNMQGYGVCEATRQGIENILREGLIIPSQKVDYHAFPIAAAANGIKSTLNIPLINVTTISVLFPQHHNDLTVFENPVYQNCYLNIGGKNFPDENVDTIGARFFENQLTAGDLDAITLQCTKEFEDSFTMPKNDSRGNRYKNTLSDATSFVFNIQTERSSAGYCYDGLDGGFGNVQIQINGQPIHTGVNDTYYNVNEEGTVHPPPCQLCLCRDTYFKLSLEGLEYVDDETPKGSQANE